MKRFSEVWKQRVGLDSCFVPCDLAALDGSTLQLFGVQGSGAYALRIMGSMAHGSQAWGFGILGFRGLEFSAWGMCSRFRV